MAAVDGPEQERITILLREQFVEVEGARAAVEEQIEGEPEKQVFGARPTSCHLNRPSGLASSFRGR